MEQKIIILIDNQKYFEPKKKPFLDEISQVRQHSSQIR